ncbi:selenocysteine-specific translation elongation factor [Pseudoduganella aquatica]|uniref:Selenocysteine-specific elongation factor n=1 Tax=Pseudoduganella aquatica TaxID=2660641 RepID=A0A7X4H7U0_9BURK|nr:selenocysteine-specific translation elongation factor [Pseudoduganella aquatica]MYN06314.1 selenocysteine-specific translation elongation factor [Pseudoduganella aquatica]
MIVGTAGHIDHGKTALTRALTGVDTDRLKEEKERGISIELGYAYAPLEDGSILGVIDVPGHEKFIRTMAAGITGIDFALLVIAADDGIMPQTLEHLAILRLLGVRRGAVALNKADRVAPERLQQLETEIARLLEATAFAGCPIFPTAATVSGDAGVSALLLHLAAAARALPIRDEQRLFRLGVDRVFTLAGQGTVVTGTALAGSVAVGDTLTLAPSGQQVRVRGIHAQNRSATEGRAGQRLALKLAGAAREDIERGSWIVAPELAACSSRIDVELTLLPGSGAALKAWSPVHVHLGAAHRTANVVPLDADAMHPGQSARVQLVFEQELHAVPGDRFVLRNAQATQTIGGGMVLDPFGAARKRRSPARLAWLDALHAFADSRDGRKSSAGRSDASSGANADGSGIAALLACSPHGLALSTLVRLSQLPPGRLALPAGVHRIPLPGGDELLIDAGALERLQQQALAALADFHARTPDEAGPDFWRLKRIASPDSDNPLWSHALTALIAQGSLARKGNVLHLPSHSVELSAAEQALADRLMPELLAGRYDPPWVRDLSATLAVPEGEVRRLLRKLARAGSISQIVPDLFYHPAPLAELAHMIATLPDAQAATLRDAAGLGRKRAVQLLEFFDRVGYTRRVRNSHLVRPSASWTHETKEGIPVR